MAAPDWVLRFPFLSGASPSLGGLPFLLEGLAASQIYPCGYRLAPFYVTILQLFMQQIAGCRIRTGADMRAALICADGSKGQGGSAGDLLSQCVEHLLDPHELDTGATMGLAAAD